MAEKQLPTVAAKKSKTIVEVSDDVLIEEARALNSNLETHQLNTIEAYWRLGEKLSALRQRHHLHTNGRWDGTLKQIGVTTTTDSYARRFFASCTFESLSEFRNKSQALRTLGILAQPRSIEGPTIETTGEEIEGSKSEPRITTQANFKADFKSEVVDDLQSLKSIADTLQRMIADGIKPKSKHRETLDLISSLVTQLQRIPVVR